ncbi:MAG: DUF4376 domain-containing protein [Candidatus Symbiothrix sp.]|jgi:hypothetical protein|nr:DUF4376 domain-containing protein [Candidatus Symbiothrix sp.]
MAHYDSKPSVYEANGDGSFTYRWNIREVQSASSTETDEAQEQKNHWECDEVVVWATVTREKLIAAVLAVLWNSDYESKLVNDYNAAKFGRLDSSYIKKYEDFIKQRKSTKRQVESDYRTIFNIPRTLQDAINEKLAEIEDYDTSDSVNSFLVNGIPCWIDKEMRAVYGNSVASAKKLGEESLDIDLNGMIITLPVDSADMILASIQRYADKAAIITSKHKQAVSSLLTIEEADDYDHTDDYPEKVTLNI